MNLPTEKEKSNPSLNQSLENTKENQESKRLSIEDVYNKLSDPQTESDLMQSARSLSSRFRGNWFSILQILKKTGLKNPLNAVQLMNMLVLKGLAIKESRKSEIVYKIVLNRELIIKGLTTQLTELELQGNLIRNQIQEQLEKMRAETEAPQLDSEVQS